MPRQEPRQPTRARAGLVLALGAIVLLVVVASSPLWTGATSTASAPGAVATDRMAAAADGRRGSEVAARVPVDGGRERRADAVALTGRVRDAFAAPLAGVAVVARRVGSGDPRPALSVATDVAGRFALELATGAAVELSFSHPGHRPRRVLVLPPADPLDVILQRSPSLRGRVVRRDGAAVDGALVRWSEPRLDRDAGATTATGPDGRFEFAGVPSSVDLEVLAPGALPVHRYVRVRWGDAELVVTVEAGRAADGTVVAAGTNAGIQGATVALWYYRSSYTTEGRRGGAAQLAETVTSRAGGAFSLTQLPGVAGRARQDVWLWVTAPGRAPHWKAVPSTGGAGELEVALHRAGSVRGRVVDAAGAPVRGYRVYAESEAQPLCDAGSNAAFRRQDGGYSAMWNTRRPEVTAPFHEEREAFTDAAGGYVIDGIPCPDGGGAVTVALPGGRPRVTVVAKPGEVAVAGDLVLPEGGLRRWRGVVQDRSARPVAGAAVEVGTARTLADAGGRFDFDVPSVPAVDECRVRATGYVPFRGVAPRSADGSVTITLIRGSDLAVRVADRDRRPVANASIEVFPGGGLADFVRGGPRPGALGHGSSDDRGVALLAGVPETCDVLVEHRHGRAATCREVLEGVRASAGVLRVTLDDLDLAAGTATLVVRVRDGRTNAALGRVVVVEARSDSGVIRRVAPGPEVRFAGLQLGAWEVGVAAEGLGVRRARVDLRNDDHLDVPLGQGHAISGSVVCAERRLSRPVQVRAVEVASRRVAVARTDADGRFTLAGVEPGGYRLTVEPFESTSFVRVPVRTPQGFVAEAPVEVRVQEGAPPAPVTLSVVPVAQLRVVVSPDPAACAAASVWSWAQGLRFVVTDGRGRGVFSGAPSDVLREAAELVLPLPEGRYAVTVRRRGAVLGERTLAAGESWRLQEK